MFHKKIALLNNSFNNIVSQIRRTRDTSPESEDVEGTSVLNSIFTLLPASNITRSAGTYANLSIDLISDLTKYTAPIPRATQYIPRNRILLLQQSLESNLQQTTQKVTTPSTIHSGSTNFVHNYHLSSSGIRSLLGNFVSNTYFTLSSEGNISGQHSGVASLLNNLDLITQGSIIKSGNIQLNNTYNLLTFGNMNLFGSTTKDLIFTLLGSGTTSQEVDGASNLSTILSLLSNGSLNKNGNVSLNNVWSLNSIGNVTLNGLSSFNNIYLLTSRGSQNVFGNSSKNILCILQGRGTTITDIEASLSVDHTLLATGSKYLLGETSALTQFTLLPSSILDVGGYASLNNVYTLSATPSRISSGKHSGTIIFDLTGELSSDSEILKRVLFELGITQQQTFVLKI